MICYGGIVEIKEHQIFLGNADQLERDQGVRDGEVPIHPAPYAVAC